MLIYQSSEYKNCLVVIREPNEPSIQKESTFYYKLAKQLNETYHTDLIRKEMWKDGHLVNDGEFYLVDRKRRFGFFQTDWAIYEICEDYFNSHHIVELAYTELNDTKPGKQGPEFIQQLPLFPEIQIQSFRNEETEITIKTKESTTKIKENTTKKALLKMAEVLASQYKTNLPKT